MRVALVGDSPDGRALGALIEALPGAEVTRFVWLGSHPMGPADPPPVGHYDVIVVSPEDPRDRVPAVLSVMQKRSALLIPLPLAVPSVDLVGLCDRARRLRARIGLLNSLRFSPPWARVAEMLGTGVLGSLRRMRASLTVPEDASSSVVLASLQRLLDAVFWLANEPENGDMDPWVETPEGMDLKGTVDDGGIALEVRLRRIPGALSIRYTLTVDAVSGTLDCGQTFVPGVLQDRAREEHVEVTYEGRMRALCVAQADPLVTEAAYMVRALVRDEGCFGAGIASLRFLAASQAHAADVR